MELDIVAVLGMWISLVGMILWQSSRHENTMRSLDAKIDTKIDALNTKIDTEFKAVRRDIAGQGERLARIEGHLLGSRSFEARGTGTAASGGPGPEDPEAGLSEVG